MTEQIEQVQVESEINIDHDQLLSKHGEWASGERDRASDAGVARQDIGAFIEKTGINSKALSQFRAGMKIKKDADRKDWLRSVKVLTDIAENEIMGQSPQTEMQVDTPPVPVE